MTMDEILTQFKKEEYSSIEKYPVETYILSLNNRKFARIYPLAEQIEFYVPVLRNGPKIVIAESNTKECKSFEKLYLQKRIKNYKKRLHSLELLIKKQNLEKKIKEIRNEFT